MTASRRPTTDRSDHDLLTIIDTKVEMTYQQLANFTIRLDRVEREKSSYQDLDVLRKTLEEHGQADKDEFAKLTKKVDWTQRMIWIAIGILSALEVVVPLAIYARFPHS
jgi:hypothetical protein